MPSPNYSYKIWGAQIRIKSNIEHSHYSSRKVTIGSTRAALRAGK
jgi:hypothetical protein